MLKPEIPLNENERLAALMRYQVLDTLPEQEFNDLVQLAAGICGTPIALISFIDYNRQWFKAKVGIDASEISRDISFCGHVVGEKTILIIPDATKDNRFADNPLVIGDPSIRFYAGVPLITTDDYVLGTLCVIDYQPQTPTLQQIRHLEALSRLVISQLELRKKNQESRLLLSMPELQKLSNLLSLVLKFGAIGYWEWDLVHQTKFWDDRMYELYGFKQPAVAPIDIEDWAKHIHPDDRIRCKTLLQQAILGQVEYDNEFRIVHPDGSIHFIKSYGMLIRDSQNKPQIMMGINLDLSERKQTENALRESQQLLQTVIDTFPQAVFWKDRDSVILGCNQIFGQLSGFKSSVEVIGRSNFDFGYTEAEALSYLADDQQVMESGIGKLGIQETITLSTGEQRWIETNKIPLRDLMGNIVGIMGTFQDISKRKQAEMALVESEAFNRQLVEEFPIGLASCRLNGQFVYVNPSFAKILGRTVEECLNLSNWDITPVKYTELEAQQLKLLQETGRYGPYEKEYIHKDGHLIPVSLTGLLIQQKGETLIWSSVENISDRKQVEEQLQQTNAALARATRLKDEFLANMSHELRTPLNAILGMTEILLEEVFGILNEPQTKLLRTADSSAHHLLSLINDILDVAKIESGQIQLECTSIPVEMLCASSIAFIKEQAVKKSIQLETKFSLNLPNLFVDQRRICQVLINLLTNAVKFTLEGGKVTLAVSRLSGSKDIAQQNYLRIAVIDTGIGISPENISKLFQPFVQIDSALNRQYTGTGLGLALVKQIVELHGGQVGLTSQLGVGSCFTIDLPCEPMAIPDPESTIPTIPNQSIAPRIPLSHSSHLILLAEDNQANIDTLKTYLEFKGYRLLLAKNGQEAIKQAQAEHPDLILMDIQMPGMDGIEAIQHIRRDVNLVNVPIIAVTALAMTGDRERCLAAGANDYLSKPFKLKELTTVIQRLLRDF